MQYNYTMKFNAIMFRCKSIHQCYIENKIHTQYNTKNKETNNSKYTYALQLYKTIKKYNVELIGCIYRNIVWDINCQQQAIFAALWYAILQ